MVFTSITFLFYFLPSVIILYYLIPKKYRALRNMVLLAFSLFFYFAGETKAIAWMLLSIIGNYTFGRIIDNTEVEKTRKQLLALSVVFNIGILFYFKYTNFFISNINAIFNSNIDKLNIIMPIGISFYTFQGMSYVIDVYRRDVPVQKSIANLGLYISLFPQLIAGPIVRYSTIQEEIDGRSETFEDFYKGLCRFIVGFAKKMLLANKFGLIVSNMPKLATDGAIDAWFYAVCFGLQIFFDFSGYSDMAIGLGRMFGFHFLENFNYPYMSKSVTDFWRRWHLSLSTWFRDYVYIPLGGNRVKVSRHITNIAIVWFLTGFWHGASWNFILWGLYFGVLLLIEKYLMPKENKIPKVISRIFVLMIIFFGWNIFVNESMTTLISSTINLLGFHGLGNTNIASFYIRQYYPEFIFAALFSTPIFSKFEKCEGSYYNSIIYAILMFVSVISLLSSSFNPFIYFRF